MGKTTKKTLKYGNSQLPSNLAELLGNADENDLRILIALMMAADENGEIPEEFSIVDTLGIDERDVAASLKFWRGAGIIGSGARSQKQKKPVEQNSETEGKSQETTPAQNKNAKQASAHRGGALESGDNTHYGSAELADLFERRTVTAEFIDEAQRVFGKTFNSYDTGIVVGLIDRLGFEEEAVLAILAYVTRRGKKGLRYTEKVALALYDDGYTKTADVVERIAIIERSYDEIVKIRQLFGIGDRELSRGEKTLFEKWTQRFGYDIEIIRLAYDITVDAIQKPVPKYAGTILEKWHTEGLSSVAEIEAFENKKKDGAQGAEGSKSYDLDDFFEAALQRSFEELK